VNQRFLTLDLLRGVAALAVVTLHVPRPEGASAWLPHAYLAVDLFFALSGFVLAHAYGERLAAGEPIGRFLRERLIRLYPLYLLAMLIGAVLILDQVTDAGLPVRTTGNWGAGVLANLLFLPAPPSGTPGVTGLFPAVFPAWSLMWELAANLLFAALAPRLGWRMLGSVLGVGLALLVASGAAYDSLNTGVEWPTLWGGGGRVLWSFFAGVGLYRLHARYGPFARVPDWLLVLALVAALGAWGVWQSDVALAAIGFPLLILLAADAGTNPASARIAAWLGGVSYAVYVLHAPLVNLIDKFARHDGGRKLSELPPLLSMVIVMAATLAVAHLATSRLDTPVRAWLKRSLLTRRPAAIA
jgi:peptidoglycan/LPS O-acetylase OafA/YrhL